MGKNFFEFDSLSPAVQNVNYKLRSPYTSLLDEQMTNPDAARMFRCRGSHDDLRAVCTASVQLDVDADTDLFLVGDASTSDLVFRTLEKRGCVGLSAKCPGWGDKSEFSGVETVKS